MIGIAAAGAALLGTLALAAWTRARLGRVDQSLQALVEQIRCVEQGGLPLPVAGESALPALHETDAALRRMALAQSDARTLLEQRLAQQADELAQARLHIAELTVVDALTGLPNRRRAHELLDVEILRHRRTGGTLTLMLGSIDRFQELLDTLGAARTDEVVQAVASRLAQACRCTDVVARFDRDEFVLLLPETGAQGAPVVAGKLLQAVAATPCADGAAVTLSLGVLVRVETVAADDALATVRDSMLLARRRAEQRTAERGLVAADAVPA